MLTSRTEGSCNLMLWVSAPPPLAWTEPQAVSLPSEVLLAGVGGDLALAIRHLGALQPSFKFTHHAQTLLGCGTSRASREGRREAMQTPLGDSLPSGPRVGGGSRQVSWGARGARDRSQCSTHSQCCSGSRDPGSEVHRKPQATRTWARWAPPVPEGGVTAPEALGPYTKALSGPGQG